MSHRVEDSSEYSSRLVVVQQSCVPRYSYTVGLAHKVGFELILSGASLYMLDSLRCIFDKLLRELQACDFKPRETRLCLNGLGVFSLRESDHSWNNLLLLEAVELYGADIRVLQIVPDEAHITIDVPNQSVPWDRGREP